MFRSIIKPIKGRSKRSKALFSFENLPLELQAQFASYWDNSVLSNTLLVSNSFFNLTNIVMSDKYKKMAKLSGLPFNVFPALERKLLKALEATQVKKENLYQLVKLVKVASGDCSDQKTSLAYTLLLLSLYKDTPDYSHLIQGSSWCFIAKQSLEHTKLILADPAILKRLVDENYLFNIADGGNDGQGKYILENFRHYLDDKDMELYKYFATNPIQNPSRQQIKPA